MRSENGDVNANGTDLVREMSAVVIDEPGTSALMHENKNMALRVGPGFEALMSMRSPRGGTMQPDTDDVLQ